MKKFLSLLAVLALVLSCTVMGIGTVASAAEESPEEDFLVYDGMLEEYVGAGGDVVIPASLGIVEIGERAFYENEDIVSLVIPEGVEAIGSFCFYACKNLEKLTLPYSLYEIGTHAFSQTALTEVTIPGNVDYVPYGCFSGSSLLKDVKLSYGVKEVWTGAFNTNSIQKIVFPETVEVICGHSMTLCKDASVGRIEVYICNPDCEIGVASDNIDNVKKGAWDKEVTPWSHNTVHEAVFNVYVVKDSKAHKTLEEKGKAWMAADTGGAQDDILRIHDEDQSFFDELPENQKDFGIQKPVQTGTEDPSTGENPTDTTPGGSTGSQNGTTQNNTNTNNNNGVNGDNSLTTILIVVIAAVAVIIIAVIIAMVIYLSKSKKPAKNAASTEDEIRAKIKLEEEIRAKLLKETQEEAVAETEQAVEENSSDAE